MLKFSSGGSSKEPQLVAVRCTPQGMVLGRGTDDVGPFTLIGKFSSNKESSHSEEKESHHPGEKGQVLSCNAYPEGQIFLATEGGQVSVKLYWQYVSQEGSMSGSDWQMQLLEEPGPLAIASAASRPAPTGPVVRPTSNPSAAEPLSSLFVSDSIVDSINLKSIKAHECFVLYGESPADGLWGAWELVTLSAGTSSRVTSRGVCRLVSADA